MLCTSLVIRARHQDTATGPSNVDAGECKLVVMNCTGVKAAVVAGLGVAGQHGSSTKPTEKPVSMAVLVASDMKGTLQEPVQFPAIMEWYRQQITLNTSYLSTIKYTLKHLMSCIKVYNCQLSTYKAPDPQNNKAKLHTSADIIIFCVCNIV